MLSKYVVSKGLLLPIVKQGVFRCFVKQTADWVKQRLCVLATTSWNLQCGGQQTSLFWGLQFKIQLNPNQFYQTAVMECLESINPYSSRRSPTRYHFMINNVLLYVAQAKASIPSSMSEVYPLTEIQAMNKAKIIKHVKNNKISRFFPRKQQIPKPKRGAKIPMVCFLIT